MIFMNSATRTQIQIVILYSKVSFKHTGLINLCYTNTNHNQIWYVEIQLLLI